MYHVRYRSFALSIVLLTVGFTNRGEGIELMHRSGGDYGDDEVLACEHLRAQRIVAIDGIDDAPIVCKGIDGVVLVTAGASNRTISGDGGKSFSKPRLVGMSSTSDDKVQAAGSLANGDVLVAWGVNGALNISRTKDFDSDWNHLGRMTLADSDRLEAAAGTRILQLRNGSLLLPVLRDRDEKKLR